MKNFFIAACVLIVCACSAQAGPIKAVATCVGGNCGKSSAVSVGSFSQSATSSCGQVSSGVRTTAVRTAPVRRTPVGGLKMRLRVRR